MKKLFTLLLLATSTFTASAQSSIANGAICPNITITDTKGVQHKLYDECNAGKYVVIDFFAYWCGPCKLNAPKIDELYKKYGCNSGKLIVLGNECDPGGTIANLHSFDADAGLDTSFTYPSTYGLLGGAANGTTYGVSAYPTIVLIGPDKKMINNDIWPISTIADIEAKFPAGSGITPKLCAPTAVDDFSSPQASISLSPNPVQHLLTVKSSAISDVVIYSQVGAAVYRQAFRNSDLALIDLSRFPEGLYLIEVNTNKGTVTRPFSKN